jgi:hypothetical protein
VSENGYNRPNQSNETTQTLTSLTWSDLSKETKEMLAGKLRAYGAHRPTRRPSIHWRWTRNRQCCSCRSACARRVSGIS